MPSTCRSNNVSMASRSILRLRPVLKTSTILSLAHAASWVPWMVLPTRGVATRSSETNPSEINPMVWERRDISPRARALGRQFNSLTADKTRSLVSCGMLASGTSLTTKETVVFDTPANLATSYIEGFFILKCPRSDKRKGPCRGDPMWSPGWFTTNIGVVQPGDPCGRPYQRFACALNLNAYQVSA